MIIVKIKEDNDTIRKSLRAIKDDVCILLDRSTNENYVVTYDKYSGFIYGLISLTIISINDFSHAKKTQLVNSDAFNNYVIAGNKSFLGS